MKNEKYQIKNKTKQNNSIEMKSKKHIREYLCR